MKQGRINTLVVLLIAGTSLLAPTSGADVSPTTQAVTAKQMQGWWADLQMAEPESTQALLSFSDHPTETVAFFKEHLQPLRIEQKDLDGLIEMLGSDDAGVWEPAFEKLSYFDPRLNIDLKTLIDDADDPVTRNRLIAVLSDYPADTFKGQDVKLRASGKSGDYNFFNGQGSWWAESKVSRLDTANGWNHKKQWIRADRAIVLLQHIGTPDAIAILKTMATGHPDAHPTIIAKKTLESLTAMAK